MTDPKDLEKLAAFKLYVHKRLDDAGIPMHFPNGQHSMVGCRIGDRLDYLIAAATCPECESVARHSFGCSRRF